MSHRRRVVQSAAEERLRVLIDARLRPDADQAAIDARIWDLFGEEWCVMATDLAGFSRGVAEFGIIHFLQTIQESERILVPILEDHDGILLKVEGDSFIAIFRSAENALRGAVEMQREIRLYNLDRAPEEQILLGIGLGFGRVLRIGDTEVFGNEVNSACILGESYARGYDILVTRAVRERASASFAFEDFEPVPPGAGSVHRVLHEAAHRT
jgi:adenylate cyclase